MIGEIQYYMDACGRFFFLPNYSCLVTLIYFVSYLENREIILTANPLFFYVAKHRFCPKLRNCFSL